MAGDANKIDLEIAQVMWSGVSGRPCNWSELEVEEQAEWAAMARCARLYMLQIMRDAMTPDGITKGEAKIVSDIICNLAKSAATAAFGAS